MINIKLLFAILDEGNDKKMKVLMQKFGIRVKIVTYASGTASPSILDYFGLVQSKKSLFLAIIPDYLVDKILIKLNKEFLLEQVGKGIAFTVPISSSNKFLSDTFTKEEKSKSEVEMKENNEKFHLITTIVNQGYIEQVMNAAKKAGCFGGTAIKGRGLSSRRRAKILGFNIEPEKEIILNLVHSKDKNKIMESITSEAGIKTDGRGVCLSIPVDDVIGFTNK